MRVYILLRHDGAPGYQYQGAFTSPDMAKATAQAREDSGVVLEWVTYEDDEDGDWFASAPYGWGWEIIADSLDQGHP